MASVFIRWALLALFIALIPTGPSSAQQVQGSGDAAAVPAAELKTLVDLLRDPQTRDALISQLESLAQEQASSTDAAAGDDTAASEGSTDAAPADDSVIPKSKAPIEPVSVVLQIAEFTQQIAERIAEEAAEFWDHLQRAPSRFSAIGSVDPDVIVDALLDLALVIAITISVFLVLRRLAHRIDRALGALASGRGLLRAAFMILASVVVDVIVVVLAWASGYLLTLLVFGQYGSIEVRQTLYLNAFLIIELIRVALRALLSPATGQLRFIPIPDHAARVMSTWLGVVIAIVGYGNLLVAPIIRSNVGYFAGRSVSALLALIALAILSALVIANRKRVSAWLQQSMNLKPEQRLLRFMARTWAVPFLIYLAMLCAMVITNPGGAFLPVIIVSGQILAAIVIGAIVATALKRSMADGVHLPSTVSTRLPMLEARLNAFVPQFLFVVRYLILLSVVAYTVHTLDLVDVRAWLSSNVGVTLASNLIGVALIILVCFAIWLAFTSWVDYRLNPDLGRPPTARQVTLWTLARNAFTAVLVVFALMFILSEIGIDIAPLLASAGVLGLAIGFGAQKMVQDVITGIFIQFENAMNVGDVVTVGGTTGTIERLTIRSVSLRDLDGVFHVIPFSSIDMVSNYMRGFAYHVANMGIAYRESIDEAKEAMHEAFADLVADPDWRAKILGDLEWFGLTSFDDSAVVVRARIKCQPGTQWAVGRAYNEHMKRIFDARGIEIPFPHQTIYFGEDKEGKAPPLHLVSEVRKRRKPDERDLKDLEADKRPDTAEPTDDAPNEDPDEH
ncbi:MAG: mechanosensitive ion channel [Kiloniellales bacterium]